MACKVISCGKSTCGIPCYPARVVITWSFLQYSVRFFYHTIRISVIENIEQHDGHDQNKGLLSYRHPTTRCWSLILAAPIPHLLWYKSAMLSLDISWNPYSTWFNRVKSGSIQLLSYKFYIISIYSMKSPFLMAAHPPSQGTVWNPLPSRPGPLFVASAVAPFGASWSPIRAQIGRGVQWYHGRVDAWKIGFI